MSSVFIRNGRVIDPANDVDRVCDILVSDGKIRSVGKGITPPEGTYEIDATGLCVCPGFVDLQVHVREPGREDRETIETASMAALAGGITSIVAMPNSKPAADNQTVIEFIIKRAGEVGLINVFPAGTITTGGEGAGLAEINELRNAGAVAVTDDGADVQNEVILRRAMEYARTCDIVLMSHCETETLTDGGVMHEGWVSTRLGLPGVPAESEDLAVRKNIMLAQMTGARLHVLHNSTKGAVAAIREAKKAGHKNITAEVSVQHFSLTDEECLGYNTNAKMYPPLRTREHIEAIIEAIKDDTIDAFTTDHAPHIEPEKLEPFEHAAFGSTGLETSFAAMMTYLVHPGHISLEKGISKMTVEASRVLGLNKGTLSIGADADITIFDPEAGWTYDVSQSKSRGKNSVFDGKPFKGRVIHTIAGGELKYSLP